MRKLMVYENKSSNKNGVKDNTPEAPVANRESQSESKKLGPVKVVFEFPSYSLHDETVKSEIKRIMAGALQEQLLKIS